MNTMTQTLEFAALLAILTFALPGSIVLTEKVQSLYKRFAKNVQRQKATANSKLDLQHNISAAF